MSTKIKQELLLVNLFKRFISDCKTGRRLTPSGKRISKGAIKQYEIVGNLLVEFDKSLSSPIVVKNINSNSQRFIQSEKNYWKRFFRNFRAWLYQKKYYDNYIGSITKILKTFFNYLIKDKCLNIGKYHLQFVVPNHSLVPIVLEPDQLKFLISNKAFRLSLSEKLQRTNDIFIFGCTAGLRFSDLMLLKRANIQKTDDLTYLILNTSKTGSQIKAPLPNYALAILSRYHRSNNNYLLPRITNTNINLNIKQLMEKAGWTYSLPKIRYRQGKPVILKTRQGKDFRFCDHITAHTMRRTAITTLLLLGVDEQIVRTISGHAPNSKEFYKYVALVQNHMNKQVINAFERMMH
jgi:integrase